MKLIIFFFIISAAYADSPIDCYKSALQLKDSFKSPLPSREAIQLCAGSYDFKPINCFKNAMEYKDAIGNSLTTKDAIILCSKKVGNL